MGAYQNQVAGIFISLMLVPEFLRPLVSPFNYFRWRMSLLHRRIRRVLFPVQIDKAKGKDDVPTVLSMLIHSSKEINEKVLVSRLLVLSSAAVSMADICVPKEPLG